MAGLEIKLTQIQGDDLSALAEMTGAIDGNTVPNFQATLEEIKTKGIRRLVLDMSKIKYVNSTGLGSLVKYADTFKSSGGGMALIKVPAKVKIVIEMLGLNAFFDICPDLDAALAALAQAQGGGGSAPTREPEKKPSTTVLPPRVTANANQTGQFKRGEQKDASKPASGATPAPATSRAPSGAFAAPAANGGGGFPQVIKCEGCGVQIEVAAAGNWKCPRCFSFVSARTDGNVRFGRTDKPTPLNLSLTATQDCGEGLVHLVTSVCQTAFNGQKLESLRHAVHEVAQVMAQSVYPNNPTGVYHVSIERQPGHVQIRFADSGATIETNRAAQFFPNAARQMSEFECRPHPSGGNMIRLVQRA
jgi:anti-anti-sigma factor